VASKETLHGRGCEDVGAGDPGKLQPHRKQRGKGTGERSEDEAACEEEGQSEERARRHVRRRAKARGSGDSGRTDLTPHSLAWVQQELGWFYPF
jgi:hypothetical protein